VYDEIIVFKSGQTRANDERPSDGDVSEQDLQQLAERSVRVVRIPTRVLLGQPLPFDPRMCCWTTATLCSRSSGKRAVLYGGLLPAGEWYCRVTTTWTSSRP